MSTTYADVHVPPGKSPEDLTYTQRRGTILSLIRKAGHPNAVSQTKLADHFDVNQSTISRDIDAIREEIKEIAGNRADLISSTVYKKALTELMDSGEVYKAVKVVESYNEWLYARGYQQETPDKHAVASGSVEDLSEEEREELFLGMLEKRSSDGSRDLSARMSPGSDEDSDED